MKSSKEQSKQSAEEVNLNHNPVSYQIIEHPVITEKTYTLFKQRQYTFVVPNSVNKIEVRDAIESLYQVKVASVRTLCMKPQKTFVRGREGKTTGYKKAIISLQEGYTINI